MAQTEKELEKQLVEGGNGLLSPPTPVSELVALLDRVENALARVEQSPSESMKEALSPSIKALISDNLLKHSDIDVKVSVASCISEITRITAPDAPYEDDQMKEVFKLIVSSFEQLDDKASPSYIKRTSILETVAKVRSCVVMLDLECDDLILEMFGHFFRSIRDDHPENVFSSMETIMILVLEESEEISIDLLSSILDVLKTDNTGVLPVARQLAENVVEKCAIKLKPYLLPAVKSQGRCLDDYNKVVANVCHTGSEAVEPSDGDTATKNEVGENDVANVPLEKAVEVAMETLADAPPSEEVGPASVGSPKPVMSNGTKEAEDSSAGNTHAKEACDENNQAKSDDEPEKTDVEPTKTETEPTKTDDGPSKSETGPTKTDVEPTRTETEPTKTDDGPSKTETGPTETETEPTKTDDGLSKSETGPTKTDDEPTKTETGPAKTDGAPSKSETGPTKTDDEPTKIDDEPNKSETGPAKTDDELTKTETEPTKTDGGPTKTETEPIKTDDGPSKAGVEPTKPDAESSGVEEQVKSESKPEKSTKRKGRKTIVLKGLSKPSERSQADEDKKEVIKEAEHQEKDSKVDIAKIEEPVTDATGSKEKEKAADAAPVSDNVGPDVSSPSCSENLGKIRSKKIGRGKKTEDSVHEMESKGDVDIKKESNAKGSSEGTSVSETKSQKRSTKKGSVTSEKEDKTVDDVDELNKEDETEEVEVKRTKKGKKAEVDSSKCEDKKNKGQVKGTPTKDVAKTPSKSSGKKPSSKSSGKSSKDESDAEQTVKGSSKRKRSADEEKASKTKEYGAELVGTKVKVWWPHDKQYYFGVVEHFDPIKKKHKVVYVDGDIETLKLAKEKWEIISDEHDADEVSSSDEEAPEESSETPKVKKAKTIPEQGSSKQGGKSGSSSKKGGVSSSKSKATPKSGLKNTKTDSKSKVETSKTTGKSNEDKVGSKSKDTKTGKKPSEDTDDTVKTIKTGSKTKQETPKVTAKSGSKSSKSGSKSKQPMISKDSDDEDEDISPKGNSSSNTSKLEKSQSAKKRKRSGKG